MRTRDSDLCCPARPRLDYTRSTNVVQKVLIMNATISIFFHAMIEMKQKAFTTIIDLLEASSILKSLVENLKNEDH